MNKSNPEAASTSTDLPDHPAAERLLATIAAENTGLSLEALRESLEKEGVLAPNETADLAEHLRQQNWLVRDEQGIFHLSPESKLVQGRIFVTRAGNGFIEQEDGETLAFVPQRHVGTALNGDIVLGQRRDASARKRRAAGRLPEARVVAVVKRQRDILTGTIRNDSKGIYFEPAFPGIRRQFRLTDRKGPKPGTRVSAHLAFPADRRKPVRATVADILGPEDDAHTDTKLILAEYNLERTFPKATLAEAEKVGIDAAAVADRKDLRDQHVITIDPQSAMDFDDALSMRRVSRDVWEVCVHIADVSHFVKPGSPLDQEAFQRGCSVYLPETVVPMLPEALANDLCSLKPNVDRLAFTAMLRLREDGELVSTKFVETVIRSRRGLTYEDAAKALEKDRNTGNDENTLDRDTADLIRHLHRFSTQLRARRMRSGALDMDTDEVRLELDNKGRINHLHPVDCDETHQLVEEFMLLANEAACRTLERAGLEQLHRHHPEPESAKLAGIAEQLDRAGIEETGEDAAVTLQALLQRISGRPDQGAWTSVMLSALPKAEYSADTQGHYGLAKEFYAHFTSPIRRYPDLVTHRLLKAMLSGAGQIVPIEDLQRIASQCSEKERSAQRAERHMVDMKLMRYLRTHTDRLQDLRLDATVMNAHPAGTQLYIPAFRVVGWLPASAASGTDLQTGRHILVTPASIDVTRCELEVKPAP